MLKNAEDCHIYRDGWQNRKMGNKSTAGWTGKRLATLRQELTERKLPTKDCITIKEGGNKIGKKGQENQDVPTSNR